jgi:hypothetical protein
LFENGCKGDENKVPWHIGGQEPGLGNGASCVEQEMFDLVFEIE